MRGRLLLIAMLAASASQVQAEDFRNCTAQETRIITSSLDAAKDLTVKAAAAVGDTSDYQRWFGTYSASNAEKVRSGLKGIVAAIRRGGVTVQCDQVEPDGCAAGEYAFVYSDRPYHLHLCPSFFDLPSLEALRPGARRSDFGTREGTIVHEISHFLHVAGTDDHCYSRSECALMAMSEPDLAVDNADSFQYFTEDVTYYARQPIGNKPPPAPRPSR